MWVARGIVIGLMLVSSLLATPAKTNFRSAINKVQARRKVIVRCCGLRSCHLTLRTLSHFATSTLSPVAITSNVGTGIVPFFNFGNYWMNNYPFWLTTATTYATPYETVFFKWRRQPDKTYKTSTLTSASTSKVTVVTTDSKTNEYEEDYYEDDQTTIKSSFKPTFESTLKPHKTTTKKHVEITTKKITKTTKTTTEKIIKSTKITTEKLKTQKNTKEKGTSTKSDIKTEKKAITTITQKPTTTNFITTKSSSVNTQPLILTTITILTTAVTHEVLTTLSSITSSYLTISVTPNVVIITSESVTTTPFTTTEYITQTIPSSSIDSTTNTFISDILTDVPIIECTPICNPVTCNIDKSRVKPNGQLNVPFTMGVAFDVCGKYYFISLEMKTWSQAHIQCCKFGMKLVAMENNQEGSCLAELHKKYIGFENEFWTSGTNTGCINQWRWCATNESLAKDLTWQKDKPSNAAKNRCTSVLLNIEPAPQALLGDSHCNEALKFACETEARGGNGNVDFGQLQSLLG